MLEIIYHLKLNFGSEKVLLLWILESLGLIVVTIYGQYCLNLLICYNYFNGMDCGFEDADVLVCCVSLHGQCQMSDSFYHVTIVILTQYSHVPRSSMGQVGHVG